MEHGETRIMRWLMRLFMDVESKTIASEVTRGWSKTQIGDGLLQDMLYRWSCCACLKKKSTDKTVSISVMWTVPVTMEMGGLLTVLILIIYCITMTKKQKNNISDINDDNRVSHSSCQEEYLHFLFSGDLFIFHGIFLEPLIC